MCKTFYYFGEKKGWIRTSLMMISECIVVVRNGGNTENILLCSLLRCNGGYPSAAWDFWTKDGLVSGGLYDSHVGEFSVREAPTVVHICGVFNSESLFLCTGCRPYTIAPCEHHVNGSRPPCTGEGGETPQCIFQCEAGYTPSYKQDKHYGKSFTSID